MRRKVFSKLIWVWVLVVVSLGVRASAVGAQGPNQVGLIVDMGDGNVLTRCIEFSEPEINGFEVLERAGLELVRRVEGMGGLVCSIQGVGCPLNDCWCQCKGSTCTYWSYWQMAGDQWSYSTLGVDAQQVQNGDVEGWRWGEKEPPPMVPFEQICVPPATPTPEPTSTPVPTATPTNTPVPPPSINFWASRTSIVAGECAELNWQVEHVKAVYLDGKGVGGSGTQSVCPTQNQTFELRVVSESGESRHPMTVNVVQPTPTSTSTPPPPPTSTTAAQAPPTATPTVLATQTLAPTTDAAAETPAPTWTAAPTTTASPTVEPPTPTATVPTATPTVTLTPTPRPVAQLPRATSTAASGSARPSPTPDAEFAPGADRAGTEETTNYVIFGVLMAVLVGVGAVILIQRRR